MGERERWRMQAQAGGRLGVGGGRVRAERTLNMLSMVVTRDVSKLSDWLNALASCGAAGEGW